VSSASAIVPFGALEGEEADPAGVPGTGERIGAQTRYMCRSDRT
jgi:hypothetical protein